MNNRGKALAFLVILLISFGFAMLGTTAYYFISYEKEKKAHAEMARQLSDLSQQRDGLQKQFQEAEAAKQALENIINEQKQRIATLNQEITTANTARETLSKEKQDLAAALQGTQQEKRGLEESLSVKLQEAESLKRQLQSLIDEKQRLEARIATQQASQTEGQSASATEELEKIIVATPTASEEVQATGQGMPMMGSDIAAGFTQQGLSGTVLLINQEYEFIIISVGANAGVKVGEIFEVFHNDKSIGSVQIEKLHDTMSAAKFLTGFQLGHVNEGDRATRIQ